MKSKKLMRWLSAGLSFCMMMQTFAIPAMAQPENGDQQMWKSVAFGQSTDMNFSSTILPEKVGINYTYPLGSDIPLATEEENPVQDVTLESRGGKIKSSHDGLTFYYTEVPGDKNFKLVADVTIEQLGPENGSAPNTQEGCGLMVRDVNSPGRKEPLEEGYEEYPAASNMVMLELIAAGKSVNADINLKAMARYGVNNPAGSKEVVTPNNTFAKPVAKATDSNAQKSSIMNLMNDTDEDELEDISLSFASTSVSARNTALASDSNSERAVSYSSTNTKNCYNTTLKLGLERTDSGFTTTYYDQEGEVIQSYTFTDKNVTPNIITHLDKDFYRVGFFASRNARMTVKNIQLTLTDVVTPDTTPAYVAANNESLSFYQASSTVTNKVSYTVSALSNMDGTVKIEQDGQVIAEAQEITAGVQLAYDTVLTAEETEFRLTMTTEDNKTDTKTWIVTKSEYPDILYASPSADDSGQGTQENPVSVKKAIEMLTPGGTIYLTEGVYGPINIPMTASGTQEAGKSMIALGNVVVTSSKQNEKLFILDSDYWTVEGLDIDGKMVSGSRGFMLHGSHNAVKKCKIHDTSSDAGLTITKSRGSRTLWPSYNLVENCEAYRNIDASAINADGFASKSGSGDENKFINCVSHDNADDGWDLFNTLDDGPNGTTVIENCIAYGNGNNGFKLGGEGREVAHELRNSIAFHNGLDGITDNFNPGELLIENNTSFDNTRFNYIMRPSPYKTDGNGSYTADGTVRNNVSFRKDTLTPVSKMIADEGQGGPVIYDDKISAAEITNNFLFLDGQNSLDESEFESLNPEDCFTFDSNGNLVIGSFLRPVADGVLAGAGAGANNDKEATDPNPDNGWSGSDSSDEGVFTGKGVWKQDSKGWWYQLSDGSWPAGRWEFIENVWYHFDAEGYMQTGWFEDMDGEKYYLNPVSDGTKGSMVTGRKEIDGIWYYFNTVSNGKLGALSKE